MIPRLNTKQELTCRDITTVPPTNHPVINRPPRSESRLFPFAVTVMIAILSTLLFSGCISSTFKSDQAALSYGLEKTSVNNSDRDIVPEDIEDHDANADPQIIADLSLEPLSADPEEITGPEIPLPTEEEITSFEKRTPEDLQQVETNAAKEANDFAIQYDYPMAINRKVEFFLDHFQNTQPKNFSKWLGRSTRYLPMIRKELEKEGMPLDLAYLPMIESGYRLTAYSHARATGPWQFIRSTGRLYGLRIDNYVDERRDPIKSTKAAISFLKDLYEEFGNWQLATAAYNAGAGRIRSAVRKTGSTDFWKLASSRYLRRETKYYVPKLIAAIMIAKDPERYGFTDIEYEPPLEFETIEVPRWTTLQAVAVAADMSLEDLRNLNRQLRRGITPPGSELYPLRVPPDKKELVAANLPRVNAVVTTRYKTHVVKNGDSLTRICNNYNINKTTLLKANNLHSAQLRKGQRLRIPYKTTEYKLLSESQMASRIAPAEMVQENLLVHKVRPGETISELARRYNVPMHMIAAWNNLNNLNSIRAGQQLSFYLKDLHESEVGQLASLTEKRKTPATAKSSIENSKLNAENKQATSNTKTTRTKLTYYQVKGGDSLWAIAEKFQTTPAKIRQWNSMDNNIIYPGNRLLLRVVEDIDV